MLCSPLISRNVKRKVHVAGQHICEIYLIMYKQICYMLYKPQLPCLRYVIWTDALINILVVNYKIVYIRL